MLLGIKVQSDQPADNSVWFVRLSTLAPKADQPIKTDEFKVPLGVGNVKTGTSFRAPLGRILLETYDCDGNMLRSSVRTVPQFQPNASLLDLWRTFAASNPTEDVTSASTGVTRETVAALLTTIQGMGCSRAIAPIRLAVRAADVVKKPTVLDVLLNGLRLNLEAEPSDGEVVKMPWSLDAALCPRRETQFPVLLAGQKLFDCRMVVGPANPPYNLLGGVLLFEAVHPDKPSNRLTIRVLAAKRLCKDATLASR